ncbi:hypothetical protein K2Z84_31010, partial [Candidatus Binatia bacterium]|nr:hypothetical protein [Candidatus Binatia bacterium]
MTLANVEPNAPGRADRPRTGLPDHPSASSDAQLCDEVAARVARPKQAPADSFVLHAPLELLARMA